MRRLLPLVLMGLALVLPSIAKAQTEQQSLVDRATLSVQEMLSDNSNPDARNLLRNARGVMLCPRVFKAGFTQKQVHAMADALQLFGKGASWGGYESLALPTSGFITRTANSGDFGGQMMRLHIGLEDPADLIADLAQGLQVLTTTAA